MDGETDMDTLDEKAKRMASISPKSPNRMATKMSRMNTAFTREGCKTNYTRMGTSYSQATMLMLHQQTSMFNRQFTATGQMRHMIDAPVLDVYMACGAKPACPQAFLVELAVQNIVREWDLDDDIQTVIIPESILGSPTENSAHICKVGDTATAIITKTDDEIPEDILNTALLTLVAFAELAMPVLKEPVLIERPSA